MTSCDVDARHVSRTLLVGDEPRDIVFAGPHHDRAFITTAHRGQNSPRRSRSLPRTWAAPTSGCSTRTTSARPRAAAPDEAHLLRRHAARARRDAGRQDRLRRRVLLGQPDDDGLGGAVRARCTRTAMPGLATITCLGGQVIPQPPTGLIVKSARAATGSTRYGTGSDDPSSTSAAGPGRLRDRRDGEPARREAAGVFAHVGTTLFNMAVNPKSGKVYVSNTDAHNDVRFEGHTPGFTSVARQHRRQPHHRHRSRATR